jgi:hypothetical protein
MSTTQRNDAPVQAVVTLSRRDAIRVRAALLSQLTDCGRLVTKLAGQYALEPLVALGDDVEDTIGRTLDLAGTMLDTVVAVDAQGVFDTDSDAATPPPSEASRDASRKRWIAGWAALADVAVLAWLVRRRRAPSGRL